MNVRTNWRTDGYTDLLAEPDCIVNFITKVILASAIPVIWPNIRNKKLATYTLSVQIRIRPNPNQNQLLF